MRVLLANAIFLFAGSVQASSIYIDFGDKGTDHVPSSSYGAAAGVPGEWNVVTSWDTATALTDINGDATGASISLSSSLPFSDGWVAEEGTDQLALQGDNFYVFSNYGGSGWAGQINGLSNGVYSLFLYAPNNGRVQTGDLIVNGVSVASVASGSIQKFVTVTDGTLSMTSSGLFEHEGLAGLQIVTAVPVPGALWLLGSALAGLGWMRRR